VSTRLGEKLVGRYLSNQLWEDGPVENGKHRTSNPERRTSNGEMAGKGGAGHHASGVDISVRLPDGTSMPKFTVLGVKPGLSKNGAKFKCSPLSGFVHICPPLFKKGPSSIVRICPRLSAFIHNTKGWREEPRGQMKNSECGVRNWGAQSEHG
jgi:hypothetical protein